MKSIFDTSARDEIISRINTLNESCVAQRGKMNVYQMIKHCILWEEMLLGKKQYKQGIIGRLFGKMALKDMMKDEPIKHNLPTIPSFKITDNGDVASAKAQRIKLLMEHSSREASGFMHPFFGKLTAEQAGAMDYKHIDHHLKQFNS